MEKIVYLLRRLFYALLVLLGVITIVFFISHLVPGDPTLALVGPSAPQDIIDGMRAKFGLDKPVLVQYVYYLKNLFLHQDLGFSIQNQRPVAEDIRRYLPATFELVTVAMLFAVLIAVPFGVLPHPLWIWQRRRRRGVEGPKTAGLRQSRMKSVRRNPLRLSLVGAGLPPPPCLRETSGEREFSAKLKIGG